MQAERQRHNKYKKQEEEREVIRQGIRDKVSQPQLVGVVSVGATNYCSAALEQSFGSESSRGLLLSSYSSGGSDPGQINLNSDLKLYFITDPPWFMITINEREKSQPDGILVTG